MLLLRARKPLDPTVSGWRTTSPGTVAGSSVRIATCETTPRPSWTTLVPGQSGSKPVRPALASQARSPLGRRRSAAKGDGGRCPRPHARYLGMTWYPPFCPVSPSELDHAGVRYWPVTGIKPGLGERDARGAACSALQRSLTGFQPSISSNCRCSVARCT